MKQKMCSPVTHGALVTLAPGESLPAHAVPGLMALMSIIIISILIINIITW